MLAQSAFLGDLCRFLTLGRYSKLLDTFSFTGSTNIQV